LKIDDYGIVDSVNKAAFDAKTADFLACTSGGRKKVALSAYQCNKDSACALDHALDKNPDM
jgi:hypothetical protein